MAMDGMEQLTKQHLQAMSLDDIDAHLQMVYRRLHGEERAPTKEQSPALAEFIEELPKSPRAAIPESDAAAVPVPGSTSSEEVVSDTHKTYPSEAPDEDSTKEESIKKEHLESTKEESTKETKTAEIKLTNIRITHTEASEHSDNMDKLRRQMEMVEVQLANMKTEITIQSGKYDGKTTYSISSPKDTPPGLHTEDIKEQAVIMESIKENMERSSTKDGIRNSDIASSSWEDTSKPDPWHKYNRDRENTGKKGRILRRITQ